MVDGVERGRRRGWKGTGKGTEGDGRGWKGMEGDGKGWKATEGDHLEGDEEGDGDPAAVLLVGVGLSHERGPPVAGEALEGDEERL